LGQHCVERWQMAGVRHWTEVEMKHGLMSHRRRRRPNVMYLTLVATTAITGTVAACLLYAMPACRNSLRCRSAR